MRVSFRSLIVVLGFFAPVAAQDAKPKAAEKSAPRYEFRKDHDPDGIGKFYMGREIAHVMGHLAADWLERPEREREEAPGKLMEALNLKGGEAVADLGCGSGYFTFRISDKVGPKGKVFAVDIQPEMLAIVKRRATEFGINNIELIRGTESDPKLPENSCDLILMVDVYHEFSHPWEMTTAMVKALKPGGRLVFVEYRLEDIAVPIKRVHKMSEAQVKKEMSVHPLKWVETIGTLPRQHIIVFHKTPASP
jgi:SAM-dependent methyltransferase